MRLGILDKGENFSEQFSACQTSDCLLESKEVIEEKDLIELDALLICKSQTFEIKDICTWVIKYKHMPIWISTPEKKLEEKNLYLQLGVCGIFEGDYSIEEMNLSIGNSLTIMRPKVKETRGKNFFFQLEPLKLSLSIEGVRLPLTRLEYFLLELLYENRNDVCTYETLALALFGERLEDFDESAQARVANIICKIRTKLAKFGKEKQDLIQTVRSIGYMMVLPE